MSLGRIPLGFTELFSVPYKILIARFTGTLEFICSAFIFKLLICEDGFKGLIDSLRFLCCDWIVLDKLHDERDPAELTF